MLSFATTHNIVFNIRLTLQPSTLSELESKFKVQEIDFFILKTVCLLRNKKVYRKDAKHEVRL